ncbi:hypothetical protein D3C72_2052560 [compost metagenome]
MRQREVVVFGQQVIGIAGHVRPHRRALESPVGDQRIEPHRVHDCAREDMSADFGGLFHYGYCDFGVALLDADGGGKA